MWSFLVDLLRKPGVARTVVVMDAEEIGKTRRYQIHPQRLGVVWGGSLLFAGLLGGALLAFTPLREMIPGRSSEALRENARLTAMRVRALQDSVAAQRHYIERLQQLITGRVDSMAQAGRTVRSGEASSPDRTRRSRESTGQISVSDRGTHEQPALAPSGPSVSGQASRISASVSSTLSFPVRPPVVNGFPTREFDAQTGHYGIDVAVSEGAYVRAVHSGYVVLADWTRDGGHTIAVQHANGYLSVYKHNKRLLKHLGDRVEGREPLAVSGNTGEITTGPHLHFELWRNGLAQDPRSYVTGW